MCPHHRKEASILGGDRILVLAEGEACLGNAFFQVTSFLARTGKFKMGIMLASVQEERIQEGISEPLLVKDHRLEGTFSFSISVIILPKMKKGAFMYFC